MNDAFLSRLVPSLENCRKIPEGKFRNSFFHWVESYDDTCHEYLFKVRERKFTLLEEYPAPTVDDILKEMPMATGRCSIVDVQMLSVGYNDGRYIVEYQAGEDNRMREGISLPDVLIEAWLDLQRSKQV